MSAPVPIKDAFNVVVEEMAGAKGETAEETADAIIEQVAERYGVPFEEIVLAVLGEQKYCLALLEMAGPSRAFIATQIAAFLAGVRWESGRHT